MIKIAKDFLSTKRGMLLFSVFLAITLYVSAGSMIMTSRQIPWEYMPAATVKAAGTFFDVNFIPLAEQYLAFINGVGDVQASAYSAVGQGMYAAAVIVSDTKPVAAAARWYVDSSNAVDARLTPR